MKKLDIDKKNLIVPFFIILMSIIFIIESIFNKSFTNKIIMASIIIVTVYLFFKNKFDKKNYFFTALVIAFFFIFIIEKILSSSNIEITYIIFKFFEIILFPYSIFILLNIPKSKKLNDILTILISTMFFCFFLLQIVFSKNFITNNILIFFIIVLKFIISKNNNKIINLLFDILFFIIGILSNSIILCIIIILFNLKPLVKTFKKKKQLLIYSIVVIAMITCTSILIYNNFSDKHESKNFVSTYEFPTNKNSEADKLKLIFKNRDIKEKILGTTSVINNNNYFINNYSIIYLYLYLGILGFIIYILITINCLKPIFKTSNRKYESTILLIYSLASSVLLVPLTYLILSFVLTNDSIVNDNDYKISKLKKMSFVLIILLFSIITLLFINNSPKILTTDLTIIPNEQLEVSKKYELTLVESKVIKDLGIEENLYYYQLSDKKTNLAYITYVVRKVDSVTFKFITIENQQNALNINIQISEDDLECKRSFEDYNIEREYSNLVGNNKLKLPIGYFSDSNKSYIISRTFKYDKLVNEYDNQNKSTIYELISQDDDLKNNKKIVNIASNINADIYIVESNDELLMNEESIDEYISLTNNNSSWYTFYGNNYKLQYSINPFTREGYGKNLGRLIEEDAYKLSKDNESIMFSALSKNAIFSLYNHTAINTENNLWLTNYTSTWLSKDYGITSYYIDTRFNETIGYLLLNLYYETNNERFLTSFLNYADFILSSWEKESYLVNNNRILPDYFSNNHTIKTHSSFNHQLALINYLFKSYEITENKNYYNTAKEILKGLVGFKDEWIRENNDLWYEVNSEGEFSGTDYATVTLDDLLHTQNYLYKFDKELNVQLTKYIESKLEYLKSQNITIPSNTLKLIEDIY